MVNFILGFISGVVFILALIFINMIIAIKGVSESDPSE